MGLGLAMPETVMGDTLEDGIRQLGRRVAGVTRGVVVTMKEQNKSVLGEVQVNELSKSFADELRRDGTKIASQEAQTKITLTLSENSSGYVGVARVQRGEESQELIQFLGRGSDEAKSHQNSRITLRGELLFSSVEPMLDVASPFSESDSLLVLREKELDYYDRDLTGWKLSSKTLLPRKTRAGRDLKGRLRFGLDTLTVLFPEETCGLSLHSGDSCQLNHSSENVSQVSDETLGEDRISAGIEAIKLIDGQLATEIVAGKDGKLRFYHDASKAFLTVSDFGDKMTSIKGECGGAQQVLVTGRGDGETSDAIQTMELHDDVFVAIAPAISFPGPVTVLRPANRTIGIPSAAAIAVMRNLQSGNYEAYRLTISCGN
jgi:hypothetical protein